MLFQCIMRKLYHGCVEYSGVLFLRILLMSIRNCELWFAVSGYSSSLFRPLDAARERCCAEVEACVTWFQCDVEVL